MTTMRTYTRHGQDCPKCGYSHHDAQYQPTQDLVRIICGHCGYTENQLPRDRKG